MEPIIKTVGEFIGSAIGFFSGVGDGFIIMIPSLIFFLSTFQGKKIKGKIVDVESCGKYKVKEGRSHWIKDLFIYTIQYENNGFNDVIRTSMDSSKHKEGELISFEIEDGVAKFRDTDLLARIFFGFFVFVGFTMMYHYL